jgi:hypothetical protein
MPLLLCRSLASGLKEDCDFNRICCFVLFLFPYRSEREADVFSDRGGF